jgi:hypothetical protein
MIRVMIRDIAPMMEAISCPVTSFYYQGNEPSGAAYFRSFQIHGLIKK